MTKPTVVILAGGDNTRAFPFNIDTHKSGITLLGKPLLHHTLHNLAAHGYTKAVVVVGTKDADGRGMSGDATTAQTGVEVKWVTQPIAKGMGNAVLLAQAALEKGQPFAVISPYHFRAGEVLDELLTLPHPNAVCCQETAEPWDYGILEVENNELKGIVEKPAPGTEPSKLKIETIYLLNDAFLDILSQRPDEEYNFESALDVLAKQQPVAVHQLKHPVQSLKYGWHLFPIFHQLLEGRTSNTAASAQIAETALLDDSHGPIIIAEGARINDFAKVVGPAYIGENALVGDYSFIRESSLEANASVGAKTEVVRSIVMPKASVHFGYLADSILGPGAKVGAGIITANKRLDRQTIQVTIKGKRVDTRMKALGILVGARAQLGIRVSTMPGICIGAEALVYPHQVLTHNIDHKEVVKPATTFAPAK